MMHFVISFFDWTLNVSDNSRLNKCHGRFSFGVEGLVCFYIIIQLKHLFIMTNIKFEIYHLIMIKLNLKMSVIKYIPIVKYNEICVTIIN